MIVRAKVYQYNLKKGYRYYIFLVGRFQSEIKVKGRKRINLVRLFQRTTTERSYAEEFIRPDREYTAYVWLNVSKKERVSEERK